MTTEIAIINREAVALAADSAVTISGAGGEKVYNSANKLFALSPVHPIGVMFYGNAALNYVPWETVIKTYRHKNRGIEFDSVSEYAEHFFDFIEKTSDLFLSVNEEIAALGIIRSAFFDIKNEISNEIKNKLMGQGKVTATEERNIIKRKIKEALEHFESLTDYYSSQYINHANFKSKYSDAIQKSCDGVFGRLSQRITQASRSQLRKIAVLAVQKEKFSSALSGVVFSGFGKSDLTPDLATYNVDLLYREKLKWRKDDSKTYSNRRPFPAIFSFAQDDVISTFIEGISPAVEGVLQSILESTLESYFEYVVNQIKSNNQSGNIDINAMEAEYESHRTLLVDAYVKQSDEVKKRYFREPLESVVGNLPR